MCMNRSKSAVLAANQGLYNGFLSLGISYGLFLSYQGNDKCDETTGGKVVVLNLLCVALAGIYGAATFSKSTLRVMIDR